MSLLSVFTQLFLFEQQPLWLWCKNKLIPKPLLAMSWLSVYCLSTHTEKRGKLVSFHEVISVLISMLRCFLYMKNKNAPLSWRNLIFLASWDQNFCYFPLNFFKKLIYLNWRIITIFWWFLPHITWISFFKESSKVILFFFFFKVILYVTQRCHFLLLSVLLRKYKNPPQVCLAHIIKG